MFVVFFSYSFETEIEKAKLILNGPMDSFGQQRSTASHSYY